MSSDIPYPYQFGVLWGTNCHDSLRIGLMSVWGKADVLAGAQAGDRSVGHLTARGKEEVGCKRRCGTVEVPREAETLRTVGIPTCRVSSLERAVDQKRDNGIRKHHALKGGARWEKRRESQTTRQWRRSILWGDYHVTRVYYVKSSSEGSLLYPISILSMSAAGENGHSKAPQTRSLVEMQARLGILSKLPIATVVVDDKAFDVLL
ncbi:hypothetical protein IW262DRAFT_1297577 [Armillaria fumosa]|nr:hypothetical protein IW262DRAFT_1297577 [Armillaria fumosa]